MAKMPLIDPFCLPREGWQQWQERCLKILNELTPKKLVYSDDRALDIEITAVTGWEHNSSNLKKQKLKAIVKLCDQSTEKTIELPFDLPFRRTNWGSFYINNVEYVVIPQLGFKEGIHLIDQANQVVSSDETDEGSKSPDDDIFNPIED
ncbi:MAG: hypothetical protein HOD92_19930, partial [Deltaproteobacteria bacterium]|nr:hypothetical protein [Deltaproteobacteria bacterium]